MTTYIDADSLRSALAGLEHPCPALSRTYSLAEHSAIRRARMRSGCSSSGTSSREGSALPSPSEETIVYPRAKPTAPKVSVIPRREVGDEDDEEGYFAESESDINALVRTRHLREKRRRAMPARIEGPERVPGNTAYVGLGLGLPAYAEVTPSPPTYATDVDVDDVPTSPTTVLESGRDATLSRPQARRRWDSWPPAAPSPSMLPSPTLAFGPPMTTTFSSSPAWPPVSMAPSPSMLPSPRFAFMGTPGEAEWPAVAPSPSMLPTPVF